MASNYEITATADDGSCTGARQLQDVAQGKPATSSSVAWGGRAGRAVDGNADTTFTAGSCTHSADPPGDIEWWQVDLGQTYDIQTVNIWHRSDCCQTRLLDATVIVSETSDYSSGITCGAIDDHLGEPDETNCNIAGRYVTVEGHDQIITICELQAMAVIDPSHGRRRMVVEEANSGV